MAPGGYFHGSELLGERLNHLRPGQTIAALRVASIEHHRVRQTPHQYLFGLQHLVNEHDHVDQAEVLFKEGGRNETRAR